MGIGGGEGDGWWRRRRVLWVSLLMEGERDSERDPIGGFFAFLFFILVEAASFLFFFGQKWIVNK